MQGNQLHVTRVLFTWIGGSDLSAKHAQESGRKDEWGPIMRLLRGRSFDLVVLLNDVGPDHVEGQRQSPEQYQDWLEDQLRHSGKSVRVERYDFQSCRNHYQLAYEVSRNTISQVRERLSHGGQLGEFACLLTPGYSAVQTGILLAAITLFSRQEVTLYNTLSKSDLVAPLAGDRDGHTLIEEVSFPYTLSLDLAVDLQRRDTRTSSTEPISELPDPFVTIKGESNSILATKQLGAKYAKYPLPIHITGPTGVGKELFARAIHESSPRNYKKFVPVNCAAIPKELETAALFGAVKGAFTGAENSDGWIGAANGGTLFLDEIGELSLDNQATLLRVLEGGSYNRLGDYANERKSDFRLLSATNRSLEEMVATGTFRLDLFHRIATLPLRIPPLSERGDDVKILAQDFLDQFNSRHSRSRTWAQSALEGLKRYRWIGNVRQLRNYVERLAVVADSDSNEISLEDVERNPPSMMRSTMTALPSLQRMTESEFLSSLAAHVEEALERFQTPGTALRDDADNTIGKSFADELLRPLTIGRALQLTSNNAAEAGRLFQKGKFDQSKNMDVTTRYDQLSKFLNESMIYRIRGKLA